MATTLQELRSDLDSLIQHFKRIKTLHVNKPEDRNRVRDLVQRYFEKHKPELISLGLDEAALKSLNMAMGELLRCAQRRNLRKRYVKLLGHVAKVLNELEATTVEIAKMHAESICGERERRILETLQRINSSAASCYEQGLMDLLTPSRSSWRGTIVEFREALRETLDYLAPDEEIRNSSGFKLDPSAGKPTMSQKARFILMSRGLKKGQTEPTEKATLAIEQVFGGIVRSVYDRASVGVHTTVEKKEAFRVKEWVTMVLEELLEARE